MLCLFLCPEDLLYGISDLRHFQIVLSSCPCSVVFFPSGHHISSSFSPLAFIDRLPIQRPQGPAAAACNNTAGLHRVPSPFLPPHSQSGPGLVRGSWADLNTPFLCIKPSSGFSFLLEKKKKAKLLAWPAGCSDVFFGVIAGHVCLPWSSVMRSYQIMDGGCFAHRHNAWQVASGL